MRSRKNITIIEHSHNRLPDDIFDWLQGCHFLITCASAVAYEAMMLDIPVITIDYCNEIGNLELIKSNATFHVKTIQELQDTIGQFAGNDSYGNQKKAEVRSFIEHNYYKLDGRSSFRCAEEIMALL